MIRRVRLTMERFYEADAYAMAWPRWAGPKRNGESCSNRSTKIRSTKHNDFSKRRISPRSANDLLQMFGDLWNGSTVPGSNGPEGEYNEISCPTKWFCAEAHGATPCGHIRTSYLRVPTHDAGNFGHSVGERGTTMTRRRLRDAHNKNRAAKYFYDYRGASLFMKLRITLRALRRGF